jgi:hypothetical protein
VQAEKKKMNNKHLNDIIKICYHKKLVVGKVLGLYEYKCKQYTFRDDFNGKHVNYMQPEEQYNRAYKVIEAYLNKEKGEAYDLLKIQSE